MAECFWTSHQGQYESGCGASSSSCADPWEFLRAIAVPESEYIIDPCIYEEAFTAAAACDDGVTYAVRSPDEQWVIVWSENWLTYEDGTKLQLCRVVDGAIDFTASNPGGGEFWGTWANRFSAAQSFGNGCCAGPTLPTFGPYTWHPVVEGLGDGGAVWDVEIGGWTGPGEGWSEGGWDYNPDIQANMCGTPDDFLTGTITVYVTVVGNTESLSWHVYINDVLVGEESGQGTYTFTYTAVELDPEVYVRTSGAAGSASFKAYITNVTLT